MRRSLALVAFLAAPFSVRAQDGVIDLNALPNYAQQVQPVFVQKDNAPAENQITDAGATLGRVLFYDKRLSRNNTVSCSSCHQQAHAFGDTSVASTGVAGTTGRHAMRLINTRFSDEAHFFWDERAVTLESQATQPIQNAIEMGFSGAGPDPTFADFMAKLSAIPEYQTLFNFAFGSSTIDETRLQNAIAQFVRSIQSFDSKYDAGRAAVSSATVPFPNFTTSQNNGKQLFLTAPGQGGAGCAACHRPPEFDIDPNSGNNGVTDAIGGGTDLTNTRSPTLRDLAGPTGQMNGPFMHNGAFSTITQIINHYSAIPGDNANLDPRLRRPGGAVQTLNLTAQQRLDLEAFLLTLSGNAVYTDKKWSDPFRADGTITVINGPSPTPTPAQALNISTRLGVGHGDNVMIGGFIIQGTSSKPVLIRGLGPSLTNLGLTDVLLDPILELRGANGALLFQNDNWKDAQRSQIEGTLFQPADDREAVIIASLAPAAYTAILTGKNQTTGIGLIEIYDRDQAVDSQLANISTRGFVGTHDNVMIGGFILGGNANTRIAIRGLGPSLSQFGLTNVLPDPTLELHNANGAILITNDNWTDDSAAAASLNANGLALANQNESAIFTSLPPGQLTAILAGKNGATGIGTIEIYNLLGAP